MVIFAKTMWPARNLLGPLEEEGTRDELHGPSVAVKGTSISLGVRWGAHRLRFHPADVLQIQCRHSC
jgi:hypothetical protein